MRNGLIALLALMAANASLARGQNPSTSAVEEAEVNGQNPISLPEPQIDLTPGPDKKDAPEPGAMVHGENEPAGESAEEEIEEGIARKPKRFWVRGEALLWWIKNSNFPPLLTTGATTDPRPGALGSSNTSVLFGHPDTNNQDRAGGRFFVGWWLDDEHQWGLEAGYFFLGDRSVGNVFPSPGNPLLARPFFNVNTGLQDASIVAFPGVISGRVTVDATSFLEGAEANMTAALLQTRLCRVEALAGFRYVNLNEGLHVVENDQIAQLPPAAFIALAGQSISVGDLFDTRNNFYGGQIGMRAEVRHKRWSLDVLAKVALGDSNEMISIHGFTGTGPPPASFNAGLLAVASNSGQFTRDVFAVVPEVGANLGFQFTDRIRGFVGYSFLYWSNVARPGDQVDTAVNLNEVPTSKTFGLVGGPARPAFAFHSTDFYAHGVNFGLEFRY